jgi:cell division septation protein DedD
MAQELNRLGVQVDSLNKSSNIKLATINKTPQIAQANKPNDIEEKTTTNEPTVIQINNDPKIDQIKPQPTKIDYKPLQEAMDSAIGIEDEQAGPFTEPKSTKLAPPHQDAKKRLAEKSTHKNKIKNTPTTKKQLTYKKHKANTTSLTYAVQLASFKNKASAYSLEKKLKSSGFNAVVKLNKKIYKVLVISKHNSKHEAEKLHKTILLKYKINGYIKRINL